MVLTRTRMMVTRRPEDLALMFAGIVRKLGAPISCKQGVTTVSANTSGNTIESECETTVSLDTSGHETFEWRKSGGVYRLSGYHITSNALITR